MALSILADIVAKRRRPSARTVTDTSVDATTSMAVDPVCGMTVAATDASLHLDHGDQRHYFCGTGCLRAFAAEPDRFGIGSGHEGQR